MKLSRQDRERYAAACQSIVKAIDRVSYAEAMAQVQFAQAPTLRRAFGELQQVILKLDENNSTTRRRPRR